VAAVVIGLGLDLVDIWRVQRAIERHAERFTRRVFTDAEVAACRSGVNAAQRFAGRFAAKEAAAKALGTGFGRGVGMREIEIVNDALGKPELRLSGGAADRARELGVTKSLVTITHALKQAAAVVVLEGGGEP
jgi:holo-[acyl-carrier protein] synthase